MLAFIGSGGAGKSSAVGHLAAAYVQAGADVAVISLRGDGTLANRLHPLGIGVISADDATQAKQRLGARKPLIVLDRHARRRRQHVGRRRQEAGHGP